ncbi:MAG: FAD-dependent oxidoreductase [Rhodopirellula sp.]|nr:FAD-dependent oxidoreductase [Rhodopirellula sp.]
MRPLFAMCLCLVFLATSQAADSVLIEAESFENSGGWKLDTQFIDTMGSPYLLAHGLGRPVKDATATVELPSTGTYHVFVRTVDWVARWNAKGQPGRFEVSIDGKPLKETFGTKSSDWAWQDGGVIDIDKKKIEIGLHDLTGFDGRCDAILLTKGDEAPPNDSTILAGWRRKLLGLDEAPTARGPYDLVVIGGGYAGMGAALSAARMGCKVALVQNRPVLGGNGSSEVRVWAMGNIRRGKYPRIGEIIEEFCDHAKKSPGTYEEFGDAQKEAIVRAEKNIDLFLNHHAYKVDTEDNRIVAVHAFDTRTSEHSRFTGKLFSDCTGHGTIGYLAKAEWNMADDGRMGMSNMWAWANAEKPTTYPETPWALDLVMKDFPYPRDFHGQWFWESGFDKDPLGGAESIRDWNLRAVYGAFNAMKNRDGAAEHKNAFLTWVAYVGGPRESRLLQGDVVLTQDDIVAKKEFPDGCVPSTWSIDLHYPKEQYAEKFKDNPFISYAVHDRRVDRAYGYPVPYRCFYSRNIDNLFMAGRCISVTHQALGTVRVMKTCGMMGEVVGKAASICTLQSCTPRDVYERYLDELKELLVLPGKARRETVSSEITIPKDALALAGPTGPMEGIDPAKLQGLNFDDRDAKKEGKWTEGTGLKGFIGHGYLYAAANSGAKITWTFKAPHDGVFDVRVSYQAHENRSSQVKVLVTSNAGESSKVVNMKVAAPLENGFASVGQLKLVKDESVSVVITADGSNGNVHADGLQVISIQ